VDQRALRDLEEKPVHREQLVPPDRKESAVRLDLPGRLEKRVLTGRLGQPDLADRRDLLDLPGQPHNPHLRPETFA
jgi:hypothetical protein